MLSQAHSRLRWPTTAHLPRSRLRTSAPRPIRFICSAVSARRSYYDILGVEQTAASEEIRAAYRSLAKAFHPDVSQEEDSHEVFAEINSAYAVLSDPEERGRYDYLWRYEQARLEASGGDPDRPLTPEEAERAAALDKLEEVHREAERARRLAKEARRAAERAKRQAAAQAREVKRQAAASAAEAAAAAARRAAAAGTATAATAAAVAGSAAAASQKQPAAGAEAVGATATTPRGGVGRQAEPARGPAAEREARRAAREAAQAAKRQAREARRHASQVRYWAQWAEHEVKTVRQTAGLEPVPSSPEEQLLWEWQQLQARQQQQQEQQQPRSGQRQQGGRRARGGAARGQEGGGSGGGGGGGWEPPAPPPE